MECVFDVRVGLLYVFAFQLRFITGLLGFGCLMSRGSEAYFIV